MLFVSSCHLGTIFDPVLFVWAFCLFVGGPVLFIISVNLLGRSIRRRLFRPANLIPPLLCLVTVAVWTAGFWRIGDLTRPIVYRCVVKGNERLAVSFMKQHPPDTDIQMSGFCYPYFELSPSGPTTVSHHAGVVSILVPRGPSTLDYLVYVSPGSLLPYSPPTEDSMGQGFIVTPLTENWYYVQAVGI